MHLRRLMRAFLLLLTFVCCACGPPAGLHESCASQPCAAGVKCLSYYGVAGPSGPLIKTCEIPCQSDLDCGGLKCGVIYDGPGQVCL